MPRYRINLIGPFGLFDPAGRRINIRSQKAVALIAIIAVSVGGVRARRKLEAMLWGSRSSKQAQDSLRRELSNLRKVLAAHDAAELLVCETKRVAIAIDRVDVDVFEIATGVRDPRARIAGDFLEGIDLPDCEEFEDWLRDERERVRDMIEMSAVPRDEPIAAPDDPPPADSYLPDAGTVPLPSPKPSLAVLPFVVLAGEQPEWLGAGIADEISAQLSAFPQLFVKSSGASRESAERGLSRTEIANRLGVRYLLEGTLTAHGDNLRVSAALISGQSTEQFWSANFVVSAHGGFAVQTEIAALVAPQIWTRIDTAERNRSLRMTGPLSDDYERYWRANALFRSWDRNSVGEAIDLALELVGRDPTCPWSASLAAYCCSIAYFMDYTPDRAVMLHRATTYLQAAMRFGSDNVEVLGYCVGTLINIGGDMILAERIVATALQLVPEHQPTLFWGGWASVMRGEPGQAIRRFERALQINPAAGVRGQILSGLGFSALQQGRFGEAWELFVQAELTAPGFPPTALGRSVAARLAGRQDGAAETGQGLPDALVREFIGRLQVPEHRQLIETALQGSRLAG